MDNDRVKRAALERTLPAKLTPPIVADLGDTRKEHIDQLRSGAGPLVDDIEQAMRCIRSNVDLASANRIFLPVVVIYTQAEGDDDDHGHDG